MALHRTGQLAFFGDLTKLADAEAFAAYLAPLRKTEWGVYAKPPFGGPQQVLAYLSRYTHRVAISNQRLVSADANTVVFRWKDYRIKRGDPLPGRALRNAMSREGMKVMRLDTHEFIRRFMMHVLSDGFHRIRHYGLLACAQRKVNIAKVRVLIRAGAPEQAPSSDDDPAPFTLREPCPCCGGSMPIIETFRRGQVPRSRAPPRKQAV